MSSPDLPYFHDVLAMGNGSLDMAELAETHGILCGMICRRPDLTATDFLHYLQSLQLVEDPQPELRSGLLDVFVCTDAQLADEEMGFRIWLPDDSQSLDERTISLAQWCTGLLAGLGPTDGEDDMVALSDEAAEALEDISQIAKAGISGDEDSEEDEMAFVEIVEYVRVVTLMLREEFRGPGEDELIH